MKYRFKSSASGDVIMMSARGDEVLQALGREPADEGIIEVAALPTAMAALDAAIARDELIPRMAQAGDDTADDDGQPAHTDIVSLRQRAWPLMEMLRHSLAEGVPIVWSL
ncbi:DUF1840 family protein [Ideonella sp. A 288]|uniref:DUF1840 family protein n=1 Tax=Ideonella sp. A 288 TaxID=1962181 RepID=UPI000B4A95DC|nr:DUF1840 family protein [Ideonella sp. A 288]